MLHVIKSEPGIEITDTKDDLVAFPHSIFSIEPPDIKCDDLKVDIIAKGPALKKRRKSGQGNQHKIDIIASIVPEYFTMKCDLCETDLPSYREAKKHYKDVHDLGNRGYLICCNKKFSRLQSMLQHCQWHMNPGSFQ